MATEIKLPRLGQGMESGTIVKWLKAEGDQVEKGEPLYELDTDKVTQEVEADASGVLLKIAVASGEVDVGRTIAVIGEQGEEIPKDVEPEQASGNGAGAPARDHRRHGPRPRAAQAPRRASRGRREADHLGSADEDLCGCTRAASRGQRALPGRRGRAAREREHRHCRRRSEGSRRAGHPRM